MLFTEAHFCTSKLILNACYRSFRRSNNNTIKGLSLSIRWAKLSDDASSISVGRANTTTDDIDDGDDDARAAMFTKNVLP